MTVPLFRDLPTQAGTLLKLLSASTVLRDVPVSSELYFKVRYFVLKFGTLFQTYTVLAVTRVQCLQISYVQSWHYILYIRKDLINWVQLGTAIVLQ